MPGGIAEVRDMVDLSAVDRARLDQIAYMCLADLLDGRTLPGYAETARVFSADMPAEYVAEQKRLARLEFIARITVIEDLSHLLDLLGWTTVERGRVVHPPFRPPRKVPPTEPARRAVAFCLKWTDAEGEEVEGDQEALEALLRRFGGEV